MSPAGRWSVLLFLAGFCGSLGALSLMLSFGSDYWLLASETCGPGGSRSAGDLRFQEGEVQRQDTFFHQGLFWRCSFQGTREEDLQWLFWITNQPNKKICVPAYLFPFSASDPTPEYQLPDSTEEYQLPDSTEEYQLLDSAGYRALWSIFLLVGTSTIMVGVFLILCGSPFANCRLYKVGGALFLTGGLCLLAVVMMFVVWTQVLDTLENYAARRQLSSRCPAVYHLSVLYGLSFLFAPVSIFFLLLAALLFILTGHVREGSARRTLEVEPATVLLHKDLDFILDSRASSDL